MKKTIFPLCFFAAVLLSCSLAQAAPFTAGSVTLDVPEGWTHAFIKGNPGQLRLGTPEGTFRMAILIGSAGGMTSEQGAEKLAKSLNGTDPKPTRNPDIYAFEGQEGDPRCMVMVKGKRMIAIMEGGDRQEVQRQITSMMESIVSADKDERAIFDALKAFYQ